MASNPSEQVLQAYLAQADAAKVVGEVLPTTFDGAAERLLALLAQRKWDACVMLGVAEDRVAITPERFALNVAHARIADNVGARPQHTQLAVQGPAAYTSTLPLAEMVGAAQAIGVAAEISNHAGTFVCNATFYRARHWCATQAVEMACGFVHLPPLAAIPLEAQVKALAAMIEKCHCR